MGTSNKVYHRKKKQIKWGWFVICALGIAYIIMFTYTFFGQAVETTNIRYGELEISETVEGYITRNEQMVTSTLAGELYPVMSEGERVSKGEAVAVVKNDNSKAVTEKIKSLTKQMGNFSTPSVFNNDIMLLDNEISSLLNSIMLGNYNESYSSLKDTKSKIEAKLNKKSTIIGENSAQGSAAREYYEQLKQYESQLSYSQQELKAPIAGVVAYKLDGYENVFSNKAISNYDVKTLEALDVPLGQLVGSIKPNSFKIVDNIEGYITIISKSDEALNTAVDKKVKLRFPEISSEIITGKVEFFTIDDDKAVITLKINRGIEKIINYRKLKVDVIWNNASGMMVPSSAIKQENDKNKVFVINGNRIIEKEVEVMTMWDGNAIIQNLGDSRVFLYDNIALDAQKIDTKKIVVINN